MTRGSLSALNGYRQSSPVPKAGPKMERQDDRTPEQKQTHTLLIVGTDKILSGWGKAEGGMSYAAWACTSEQERECFSWVESRFDMLRVRTVLARTYRPKGRGHLHIYVFEPKTH
jgi:hypothetical protein